MVMNFEDPNQLDISTEVYSLQTIFVTQWLPTIYYMYIYIHTNQ